MVQEPVNPNLKPRKEKKNDSVLNPWRCHYKCALCALCVFPFSFLTCSAFELQSDTSKAASGFALFVKENFKRVKASMPIGCRHGDVMSQLSCEYRDLKEAVSANSTVGNN